MPEIAKSHRARVTGGRSKGRVIIVGALNSRDGRVNQQRHNSSSGQAVQNATEKCRGFTSLWPTMLSLPSILVPPARMSETEAEESVPKWAGFDVQVPNVESAAEGQEVGLSQVDATGMELLLEIEMEGKRHLVLVDSGASLSGMNPEISSSKV